MKKCASNTTKTKEEEEKAEFPLNNAIADSSRRTSTYLDWLVHSFATTNEKSTKETEKASPPPRSCYFNVNCYQIIPRYLKTTYFYRITNDARRNSLALRCPSKNTRLFWMRHSYTLTHHKKQNSVVLSHIVDQCRFSSLVSRLPCKTTPTSLFYLGWPILRMPFGIVAIERTSVCVEKLLHVCLSLKFRSKDVHGRNLLDGMR